jgi:hypothetical protein
MNVFKEDSWIPRQGAKYHNAVLSVVGKNIFSSAVQTLLIEFWNRKISSMITHRQRTKQF